MMRVEVDQDAPECTEYVAATEPTCWPDALLTPRALLHTVCFECASSARPVRVCVRTTSGYLVLARLRPQDRMAHAKGSTVYFGRLAWLAWL